MKHIWNEVANLIASGKAVSAWALSVGGIAEGVCKMALGNKIGFAFDESFPTEALYLKNFGGILIEAVEDLRKICRPIGWSAARPQTRPSRSRASAFRSTS